MLGVVWTPRGNSRRIISARLADIKEGEEYGRFGGTSEDHHPRSEQLGPVRFPNAKADVGELRAKFGLGRRLAIRGEAAEGPSA